MKLDYLFMGAHPDDIELGCGGTIAKLTSEGKKTGIVDLTRGEMGTRGTIETRKAEAQAASEILGLAYRENLALKDSDIENNRANQLKVIQQIRETRPHILITGAPYDRHPDHGKATSLIVESVFYSGLRKIETTGSNGSPQEPWRPKHVLHYIQDRNLEPDFIIDITDYWEIKKKAMLAFATQFNVEQPGDEPETYISNPVFFKHLEARARVYGHMGGFDLGEAFIYFNGPVPVKSFGFLEESSPLR